MKKTNNKILYVAPSLSTFVKSDVTILSKKYDIITNIYNWKNKLLSPIYMLHQVYFVLKHLQLIKKIIISSGGYWAFFPTLIGKIKGIDVFIILNGSDCASIPSINYGSLRKSPLKHFIKMSYKMATALLPVSKSLIYTHNTFISNRDSTNQGYKHFFPDIETKAIVIHNAVDGNFWKRLNGVDKEENSFISVFSGINQFQLKGGDLIVEVAKSFPNCKFYLAGMDKPDNLDVSKNVIFLGRLTPEQLRNYYSKCIYYFQLSIFEGFGVALCEAMLCECIPIGSSVNIIPKIINNSGFILKNKDLLELTNLINQVLLVYKKNELGKRARLQILNNFNIAKREHGLTSLFES